MDSQPWIEKGRVDLGCWRTEGPWRGHRQALQVEDEVDRAVEGKPRLVGRQEIEQPKLHDGAVVESQQLVRVNCTRASAEAESLEAKR